MSENNAIPNTITVDVAPVAMKSTISGTGNRVLDAPEMRDKVVAIVELECIANGYKVLDKGTEMKVEWKMLDLFVLPADEGRERLRRARSEHRVGAAKATGEHPFEGMGDVGYIENGVVLTAAEVAERRGDGRPLTQLPAVVVIYEDESRALWPDDLPGEPFPVIGVGGVAKLESQLTGEPITSSGAGDAEQATATDDDALPAPAPEVDTDLDDAVPVDDFEAPDPATEARIAAASVDVDPAVTEFLAQGTANIKLQVRGQMSRQFLEQLYVAEQASAKPRATVVAAIEAQLAELAKR